MNVSITEVPTTIGTCKDDVDLPSACWGGISLAMSVSAEYDCPAPLPGGEIILRFGRGRAICECDFARACLEGPALQISVRILFR
jgi:hypothetical protein